MFIPVVSQDTVGLILSIRRYFKRPALSYFVPNAKNIIYIGDIWNSLGTSIAFALPHSLPSQDDTARVKDC